MKSFLDAKVAGRVAVGGVWGVGCGGAATTSAAGYVSVAAGYRLEDSLAPARCRSYNDATPRGGPG